MIKEPEQKNWKVEGRFILVRGGIKDAETLLGLAHQTSCRKDREAICV